MRDMIFVSHANPEDNDVSLWIALQLASQGYPVWSDLTKLVGGEAFWDDIEDAIRRRTAKFLYVLSRASNQKPGPRNELAVALLVQRAERLKDFVIPLWIDSLSPGEFNVELARLNAIPFQEGWAKGLSQLLQKLEDDHVAKKEGFNPSSVANWWREHVSGVRVVRHIAETLVTNWYPLEATSLYFHQLTRASADSGPLTVPEQLPWPAVKFDQYLVSFAPARDFDGKLGAGIRIAETVERTINGVPPDGRPRMWSYRDERRTLTSLLRQVWDRLLKDRQLPTYEFANGAMGFYFLTGQVEQDTLWFPCLDGTKSRRQVIGYRTMKGPDGWPKALRHWHFALEAKPTSHPMIGYTMRSHVLFSDDGKTIWESKDRLHRARRSQCKAWWNDKWRDLISATLYWLAESEAVIPLSVGVTTRIALPRTPILIQSPVSYDESRAVDAANDFPEDDESEDEELREREPVPDTRRDDVADLYPTSA